MTDLVRAADNTFTILGKAPQFAGSGIPEPVRAEDGRGVYHAIWLLTEISEGRVSGEKGHRWLGYAHGVLVERCLLTLENCRHAVVLS